MRWHTLAWVEVDGQIRQKLSLTLSRPYGTDLDYAMMADLFLVTDAEISRTGELI